MPGQRETLGDLSFQELCKSLQLNLKAALSVAGPQRENRRAGGLSDTEVFRQTGIARSTLRELKKKGDTTHSPKPDLHTLNRLADMLGIPVAYLLMTPEDWAVLIKAMADLNSIHEATEKVLRGDFGDHASVGKVLDSMRMLQLPRPQQASSNPQEQARLDQANERRRRTSHVIGTLMLRQPEYESLFPQHMALVALAASITNQIKPKIKEKTYL